MLLNFFTHGTVMREVNSQNADTMLKFNVY